MQVNDKISLCDISNKFNNMFLLFAKNLDFLPEKNQKGGV
jgi:hypothetical protein